MAILKSLLLSLKSLLSGISIKKSLFLTLVTTLVCSISVAMAADTTPVTTLTGLQANLDNTFSFGLQILVDVATVSGLGLFFLGVFSIYTSHTKQSSGGKPMSHGLVMVACGAVLIGLPYFFKIASTAVIGGSHQIGSTAGLSSFITKQ